MNTRMCILTRLKTDPKNLIKITRTKSGEVLINQEKIGRSCYIDPRSLNVLKIKKGKFLERHLKLKEINLDVFEKLTELESN